MTPFRPVSSKHRFKRTLRHSMPEALEDRIAPAFTSVTTGNSPTKTLTLTSSAGGENLTLGMAGDQLTLNVDYANNGSIDATFDLTGVSSIVINGSSTSLDQIKIRPENGGVATSTRSFAFNGNGSTGLPDGLDFFGNGIYGTPTQTVTSTLGAAADSGSVTVTGGGTYTYTNLGGGEQYLGFLNLIVRTPVGADTYTLTGPVFESTAGPHHRVIVATNTNVTFDLGVSDGAAATVDNLTVAALPGGSSSNIPSLSIKLGGGADTITFQAAVDSLPAELTTLSLDGGSGSDMFNFTTDSNPTLSDASFAFQMAATSYSINLNGSFEVANITGGAGNNSLNFAAWTGSGSFNGSGGYDTLVLKNTTNNLTLTGTAAVSVNSLFTGTSVETVNGGTGTDNLLLTGGVDAITVIGTGGFITVGGVVFQSIETVDGGNGNDSVLLPNSSDAITVNGNKSATTLGIAFTNIESIDGGSGTNSVLLPSTGDTFTVGGTRAGSGLGIAFTNLDTVDGGGGSNTLANGTGTTFAHGSTALAGVGFSNFATISTPSLSLTAGNDIFTITAAGASTFGGVNYTGLTSVDALGGADSFKFAVGITTFAGTLIGGPGSDTITTADGTNAWAISAANTGTLNTTTPFNGIETLNGGSGADTFTLAVGVPAFGGTLTGGTGTDTVVRAGSGGTLDLTAAPDSEFQSIERIDLTGSGNNTLILDQHEVLVLSPDTDVLIVDGNAGDRVFVGFGWTRIADEIIGPTTYAVFTQATATLKIASAVTPEFPPVVSVTVGTTPVLEGSGNSLVYTFTRTGDTSAPLALDFTRSGTATFTTDYTATSSGTLDYASATLTIPAGSASATVTLTPVNDQIVEGTEGITLAVFPNSAYTVAGSPAVGTITDNDTATLSFTAATSSPLENASGQRIGVQLVITANGVAGTGTLGKAVSVRVEDLLTGSATAGVGGDYTFPTLPTLTFAAGSVSSTLNADLTLLNDTVVDGTETVNFALNTLSDPTGQVTLGGTLAHTASIMDNDTAFLRFTSADDAAIEWTPSLNIRVELIITANGSGSGTLGRAVSVNVQDLLTGTATAGTDYTFASPATVTFAAGSNGAPQSVVLSLNNDALVEGVETVVFALNALSDPTGQVTLGSGSTQTVTILDDDTATIGFTEPSSTVAEAAGNGAPGLTLTVTPGAGSTGPVGLERAVTFNVITVAGGNATAGGDYTLPALVTFVAGGSLTQTLPLAIVNDSVVEGAETANLALALVSDGTGGQVTLATGAVEASHTTTITDDDTATVTLSGGVAHAEGQSGTTAYTFTATLDREVQGGFSVAYATNDGTATLADGDYAVNDGTLMFAGLAGETQTITVLVNGDTKFENTETFTVALGALSGAPAGVSVSGSPQGAFITNDDSTPTISIDDRTVAEGSPGGAASLATFTVTLSNTSDLPVTVDFATADGTAIAPGDYRAIPQGTLTFAPGETSKTVTVGIRADTLFESGADETFLVRLSNPSNATLADAEAVGTITSDDGAPANTLTLDALHPRTFFDKNHDKVTVRLSGLGTGTLILDGGVLDGADISEILLDSNAAKSTLSVSVVKDQTTGDGLVGLGEVRVNGGLAGFTGAAVDLTGGGLRATGPVKTITTHVLAGGEIITGGTAIDKLALNLGTAAGDPFLIRTPQTISTLKATSIGAGKIEAASLTSIAVSAGGLAADITSSGAIGSVTIKGGLSGELVASRFGAVTVTGGDFSGSLTSTAPAAALGATKALTSLSVTTGNLTGDVVLLGASGAITVRTGFLDGHLTAASFGAVSITGGDFSGSLTSLTDAATLRTTKALTSLTVTDGNLTGDIRLRGASGAISVKSKPALDRGDLSGASIVASAIASLTVGRDFISSIVLAGADLGADHAFGGNNDSFAAGAIGAVKIGRNVSGAGSIIGAGFNPTDGAIKDDNDVIIGGVASVIASLTVTGSAAPESYFAAGIFKVAPKIGGVAIAPTGDSRFKVG